MLWVDRYRPTNLSKLDVHADLNEKLEKLASSENFPHVMVYGPDGSGKKTRVQALLRRVYGNGVDKVRVEHRNWKVKSRTVEIVTVASQHHIELNPSDVGNDDRFVVQQVLKEIAQSVPLDSRRVPFKVVVIKQVDLLSAGAQHALRKTMEKYMATCRLILYCSSTSKVIDPVRSRCLLLRIPAPSQEEIEKVLAGVAAQENITAPAELIRSVVAASGRNLRRALLQFEATKVQNYPFYPGQAVSRADWELFIENIAALILEEQTPARLHLVRGKLYELLANCVPAELLLERLVEVLLRKLDGSLKHETIDWAAFYSHRLQIGTKEIFHLEAFVAKFMALYKRFLIATFDF